MRPRLTAGLPLSAFGPKAAVRSLELNRRRSVVLRSTSSRSHRRPMRRAPSIDTQGTGTRGNLSHIADITHCLRARLAMKSSSISEVQTKSLERLSDLCHIRGSRQLRTHQPSELMSQRQRDSSNSVRRTISRHANDSRGVRRVALHAGREIRTRPTASGHSTIAAPSLQTILALNGNKKRGRIPCPSRNDP